MAKSKRDEKRIGGPKAGKPQPAVSSDAAAEAVGAVSGVRHSASVLSPDEASQRVERLELELKATRDELQSSIEELEISNEDLRVSNMEVVSMVEELRSGNEELSAINVQLHDKVHDLEDVNNDISNLLSSTEISTLFLDGRMWIKRFTPPAGRLLSVAETDLGRPFSDLSPKEISQSLIIDARQVLENLTPLEREVWSEGPPKACYLRRIVPFRKGVAGTEGVVVTFIEITERKGSEANLEAQVADRTVELQAHRVRMQSIVDTAVDAILAIDVRGNVSLFNPSAERMFGYRAEEVMGRNVNMLMPAPYGAEHDGYLENYVQTGVKKVIGLGREVAGRRKDGTTFPVDLAVSEIKGDEESRFVGTMRDLSEIKRAHAELEREHALSEGIVSTARAIILRLDREGRILSFNPYMEKLCGYKCDEVRGQDWFTTFIPERERSRIRDLHANSIQGQNARASINPIQTRDGGEVLIEWYDATLELPGEPPSIIAIGHDVTARDRLEREFLQAQKMEAVGRLAGGVAHDFNNLLAGILGGLRIASEELDAEHPAMQMLVQVQDEVSRGASITRRLLDFSRVGTIEPSLIDPRETLIDGEKMIRRLIGEDIDVLVECDSSHSQIFGDAGQVEQAILNLSINARDAMPRGGKLEIRCFDAVLSQGDLDRMGASLSPGPHVVLSVADTGSGMDAETQSKAVEAFFTTKGPGLGTGLGLSSVSSMIERHGGHLAFESEVDVGTTVRLYFPKATAKAVAASPEPEPGVDTVCGKGSGEKILLVEDEMLVRLGVQHILEEQGYVVTAVKNSGLALEELEADGKSIDLLLTDVVLPGMGGPELAAVASEMVPGMRVLFMSAFPSEQLVSQGRISAGTTTLEKPFTDEEVARKIRGALAGDPPR
ncbi:MAG: PAS domain S-box-containing protein [Planctomycetota bacterium]|jgi:PAS domain S-box-containing protein